MSRGWKVAVVVFAAALVVALTLGARVRENRQEECRAKGGYVSVMTARNHYACLKVEVVR